MKPQIAQMTQISETNQRDPQTYDIIGAAMEVHRELGPGFLEKVYADALQIELNQRGIPFQRELELTIRYKQHNLPSTYRVDFLCFDRVVVELKAIRQLTDLERAQLMNYLRATGFEVGLLLNFATRSLEHQRMIFQSAKSV